MAFPVVQFIGGKQDDQIMQKQLGGYRADIDGLRALAVLAVISNHLPGEYLSSGFLGVDVFFVISGYVVTASTLRSNHTSFSSFYTTFLARRIRRLWPALLSCVMIVSLLALLVDNSAENSIKTGIASLFGVANFFLFQIELDYFAPSSKLNAFTHTWSLGVEEQFYLLFPLVVWLTIYGARRKGEYALVAALTWLIVISCVLFLLFYSSHQNLAYYLMPFRFWELGVGCLAYLLTKNRRTHSRLALVDVLAPMSLAALVGCFFLPQSFAAIGTVLAVTATTTVLIAPRNAATQNVLTLRPAVYLGKISYSLYLWHWPIVALSPLIMPPEWRLPSILVFLMLACAIASYHFIETPFRNRSWCTHPSRDIACGLGLSGILGFLLFFGLPFVQETNRIDNQNPIFPPPHLPLHTSGLSFENCLVDENRPLTEHTFEVCTVEPKTGSGVPRLWALGDSHTVHVQALIYELHDQLGMGVFFVATPGRPFPALAHKRYAPQEKIYEYVSNKMKSGDILLISRLAFERESWPPRIPTTFEKWADELKALADRLEERGVRVVVMGPLPIFNFDDIRQCSLTVREHCGVKRKEIAGKIDSVQKLLASHSGSYWVFDTTSILCPDTQEYCYPDDGSKFLYRDSDHLNIEGAKLLTKPFLDYLMSAEIFDITATKENTFK